MATTHLQQQNNADQAVLYMAIELSFKKWRLAFAVDAGRKPRQRTVAARDWAALQQEIQRAKARFALADQAPVRSCYEAGLDGFYVHRMLGLNGIANIVVDASSIEVNRRARRAKSDGIDAAKLVTMLMRYHGGERGVWSVVRPPSAQDEADRQLLTLRKERVRHVNRIEKLLLTQGIEAKVTANFERQLPELRTADDRPLAQALIDRLRRECQRMRLVERQSNELERERERRVRQADDAKHEQVRQLLSLPGIGFNSAYLFVMELFGWRQLRNAKEVGAITGLAPTPYASGASDREQGISKAGVARVRTMAIEIAWCWLRYQPGSELSRWFERRFASGSKRLKRIGITAMARKLLVQLWRYLEYGELPPGAQITDWRQKLRYKAA